MVNSENNLSLLIRCIFQDYLLLITNNNLDMTRIEEILNKIKIMRDWIYLQLLKKYFKENNYIQNQQQLRLETQIYKSKFYEFDVVKQIVTIKKR
jgi:hypothetical protein